MVNSEQVNRMQVNSGADYGYFRCSIYTFIVRMLNMVNGICQVRRSCCQVSVVSLDVLLFDRVFRLFVVYHSINLSFWFSINFICPSNIQQCVDMYHQIWHKNEQTNKAAMTWTNVHFSFFSTVLCVSCLCRLRLKQCNSKL